MDPTTVIESLLTLDDVAALAWSERVCAAPAPDLEVYLLTSTLDAARFLRVNGLEVIGLCRAYDFERAGRRQIALEPIAVTPLLVDHLFKIAADLAA